jgi:hypothetical protein
MTTIGNERPGERVPGSRWFRAYCVGCGTPMRVVKYIKHYPYLCEECCPLRMDPPRRPPSPNHEGEEASPWQEVAIRHMEDQQ